MTTEKGGRPLAFESVEELEKAVNSYFSKNEDGSYGEAWVDIGGEFVFMPTMSGLALALNVDRKTITNYANKEKFFPTIKRARNLVEQTLERRLYMNNPTGVIFNLKNNFGWRDQTETKHSGNISNSEISDEELDARIAELMNEQSKG